MINKLSPFWWAQLLGWGTFYSVNLVLQISFGGYKNVLVFENGIGAVFAILITCVYRECVIHKYHWKEQSPSILLPKVIAASVAVAIIWSAIVVSLALLVRTEQETSAVIILLINVLNFTLLTLLWSGTYFSYNYFKRYRRSEIDRWKLQAAVREAELNNLKSQVNPHFMFNSLNNIRALILENPQSARVMLTHLSDIMRYSINHSKQTQVPLSAELEIVQNYFELNSIQFEEKLQYNIDVEEGLQNVLIPPMIIQTLVENAIKHGISQIREGGFVNVRIFRSQEDVVIKVSNSGHIDQNRLVDAHDSTKVGLQNLKERLLLLYEKGSDFTLKQLPDQVEATITIPSV